MRIRHTLPLLAATSLLLLTACGSEDKAAAPSNDKAGTTTNDKPAGNSASLDYDTVAKMTTDELTKDPDCKVGKWDDNSTGLDETFRPDGKLFKQFDCYKAAGESFPHRVQQSIFVEFTSAEKAKEYATKQAVMYPTLVVGPTVVVAGTGLTSVDMKAYLTAVQKTAGGGGEILGG